MKCFVADLYVKFFDLLCHTMEWYQHPFIRFKSALNQNYYDQKIKDRTDDIRTILERIRHEAEQTTQSRVQDTHQEVRQVTEQNDKILSGNEDIKVLLQKLSDEFMNYVGTNMRGSLLATGQQAQYGNPIL